MSTVARQLDTSELGGYIEHPPVDDATVDCVISNGVINLSPDGAEPP